MFLRRKMNDILSVFSPPRIPSRCKDKQLPYFDDISGAGLDIALGGNGEPLLKLEGESFSHNPDTVDGVYDCVSLSVENVSC